MELWREFINVLSTPMSYKMAMICLALYFFVKYLVMPLDWTKELDESGYGHVGGSGFRRLDQIKRIRRSRKIGEVPPVYPNGWFAVAESHQVKKGKTLHVSAMGEDFVLFRGSEGKCFVLDAHCPHLGANMGVGGRVVDDCIECPFHGWQFDGRDGKCRTIPYSDKAPKFAEVKRHRSLEINDFIFVWYHAEGEEPTWFPEGIPEITQTKFIYRGRNEFKINAHIQEIPENGSDLWHFNALHGTTVMFGSNMAADNSRWKFLRHIWGSCWEPSTDPDSRHIGVSKLHHHVEFFGMKFGVLEIDIKQYGPGYVEMEVTCPFGRMLITQTVTPVEPMVQKVVHRVYAPLSLALYGTFMIVGESIMVERDIMIWNNKTYLDKPLLVKEDKTLAKYRRWFAQFYTEHSPSYAQTKKSLEW